MGGGEMSFNSGKQRLMVVRPTLGQGGADRVTVTLLQHLDRNQFDSSLTLMRREGELLGEVPEDVQIFSLNASRLWNACIPLSRLFKDEKPDIVFSTCSGANIPIAIAHLFTPGSRRLVLSERNVLFHGGATPKRITLNLLKAFLYRKADHITVVSEGVKRDLVAKLRVPSDKITVVHNPIDFEELRLKAGEPVSLPWFSEDIPIILGTGRFVREKDFKTLVRAFHKLRSRREARLVILGDGPLRRRLEKQIIRLSLQDDVLLPGYDSNPFRYMARAAVFVLSSRAEGLPNVLLQSMACGTPVVATRCHSGPEEIINSGRDGILVPVGDSEGIAEAVQSILDSPELRNTLVSNARDSMQRFGAEVIIERYAAAAWPDGTRLNNAPVKVQWNRDKKLSR
jgi:glycosyltransferase involved in cell wall biosynthesis